MWLVFETVIFLFLILVGALLIEILSGWKKNKRRRLSGALVVLLGISWLLIFYGSFIEPKRLVVNEFSVSLTDEPTSVLRAAVISDIHLGPYKHGRWAEEVVRKVNMLDADIVLLPGDFVFVNPEAADGLEVLSSIESHLGVFAVTGNHEYQAGDPDYIVDRLTSFGVNVLQNESIQLDVDGAQVILAGVSDIWYEGNLPDTLTGLTPQQTVLLLAHNPDTVLYSSASVADLVISGHTHGGQIRLPFIGPVGPIPTVLGQTYDEGFFEYNGQNLFITSGVGESGTRARLFNPPEIVMLTISL